MAQNPSARPSLGVSYCTSMSRPDAALALAAVQSLDSQRVIRANAACVVGAGLDAAIFCDIVRRFDPAGRTPNSNDLLPVGMAIVNPLPPDPPMATAVVGRTNADGEPQDARGIRRAVDTSQAEAVLRNSVTFTPDTAIVLSAPATALARCLDLPGTRDLFAARAQRLVIVDTGEPHADVPALRAVIAEWPTSLVVCGPEVGNALPFPGASIEREFAWTDAHPIADAYRAYRPMPYDAPSHDLAAVHYAAQPESGFFRLSEPGTVTVADSGLLTFTEGGPGSVQRIVIDPARRDEAIGAFVTITSVQPVAPGRRGRGAA